MPPRISKVGSSRSTQTIAKASTSNSSKSSGSSKSSSSSSVRKTTTTSNSRPTPAPKPRNVDKVDFGKPKPTASAGIYKPPAIKLIDPRQELRQNMQELNQRIKTFEQVTAKETKTKPKPSAAPKEIKPSKEDHPRTEPWDPRSHCQEDVDKMLQAHYETSKEFSQSKAGHFVGDTMIAGGVSAAGGGFVAGTAAAAATTFTETGEKVSEKIVEKTLNFLACDPRVYDDDMELF